MYCGRFKKKKFIRIVIGLLFLQTWDENMHRLTIAAKGTTIICSVHGNNVSTEEREYVTHRLKNTIPWADIVEVSYITNPALHSRYVQHLNSIEGAPYKQQIMFRGTWKTPPESIRDGGLVGYGQKTNGDWGIGWYFAMNANYAAQYAYRHDDIKQLTLALIITRNCYDASNLKAKEKPPERKPANNEAYDSCVGKKKSSKNKRMISYCCVVFNEMQIYPLYSISYRANRCFCA